jgi:putative ABC transport system permease protein
VWQARGANTQEAVAAGALGAVTVLMVLVSLVAAAVFTVIAARRQRQLGMLAAIGATRKQLRMVMVAGGAPGGRTGHGRDASDLLTRRSHGPRRGPLLSAGQTRVR